MKLIDACEAAHIAERVFCDYCYYNGVRCSTCRIDRMIELIDNTKAVDAVPVVHGYWIEHGTDEEVCSFSECSVCGTYIHMCRKHCEFETENFCPNCGAKMDEKDGEQDE